MLHVVHPYIYKWRAESLVVGPVKEYAERDKKLSDFVKGAIELSYPIVCFERSRAINPINSIFERVALESDDLFEPLFDPHITWIGTDSYGLPIRDQKPVDMSEEVWQAITETTITNSQYSRKISNLKEVIVCGGEYSRCERNFMEYIDAFHSGITERFYIPELSVIIGQDLAEETTRVLRGIGFRPVSCEQAWEIIANKIIV